MLAAFPDAYLEDPHDLPEIAQRLGDHLERVSYDSPIRSAEDIGATPLAARVVNVKPSRIGSLRALFEVYARCARERRPMYGGGMGELGVGRGQIELLAALFHADAPNDVAPSACKEDDPADGLPPSPLAPRPAETGFRWAASARPQRSVDHRRLQQDEQLPRSQPRHAEARSQARSVREVRGHPTGGVSFHSGLWGWQSEVLRGYAAITGDAAVELPTGTGKTLIGLLAGEYSGETDGSSCRLPRG